MSLLHLAWASAVTFGKWVELLPARRSAKLSLGQRTVAHCQLYITAKMVFVCEQLLHFNCSLASFFLLFSSHLPPSSSPPVLHPLRSSVKFLTFVTKTRDCECVWEFCARDGGQCQRLVGSSSLLDLLIHPPVTLSLCWSGVHLLSVCASAFPTHTRTPHYATSSSRVQTKWNTSCVRQMDFLSLKK